MKRELLIILICLTVVTSGFCKRKDKLVKLESDTMKAVESTYHVDAFKYPADNYESLEGKFISFADYNLKGGNQTLEKMIIKQKRRKFTLKIQDPSTTVSYGWEAYFKLINDENKVVQVIHKKDMEVSEFALYDCNFDGYDDLVFITSKEKKGAMYHIYYWKEAKGRFASLPDKVIAPLFDLKNKHLITTEITGDGENLYEYHKFIFGKRVFDARVKIYVPENKCENGVELSFTEKKKADFDTSAGVYLFSMPSLKEFKEYSEEDQADFVRQYNNLMKRINGI